MAMLRRTLIAESDLRDIWHHIAQDNPSAADQLLRAIGDLCVRLAELPGMGRLRPELGGGIRSFAHGSYVVFYRHAGDEVLILRVLHGARDIGGQTPI